MPFLDRPTLSLLMVLAAAMSALLLTTIWRINRQLPGLAWWTGAAGLGCLGFAFMAVASPYVASAGVATLLSSSLLFAALLLILEGSLRFMRRDTPRRWWSGLVLLPVFMGLTWGCLDEVVIRRVFHDSVYAVLLLGCALAMLSRVNPEERLVNTLSALFMLGMALVMALRAVISSQIPHDGALDQHPIHAVVYLLLMLFVMGWTYCVHMACYLRSQAAARQMQREDFVTTLPGPHALDDALRQEIARSQRTGLRFSYLLIEVAEPGQTSDAPPPALPPEVLRAFGQRLRQFARDADFACHLGDGRFVVLLHHTPSQEHLRGAIARLRHSLLAPIQDRAAQAPLDVNIGMAMWPLDGPDTAALGHTALQRMQAEKFSMFKPFLDDANPAPHVAST
ncbi:GGDEF domain-containing protein [Curvibacter sp. HBC61]|uniref:GGDEF domain-containing protein n=1 Tax=Curvibacter cyanobacteriorum TaxID=3026422 RepID=A0ABT5MT79_9BURK|nr:GGDEF domain-containing protein [Curvibacter sp. HBC61]MDD0837062.1 GGDEF domain-containing protein [Curvibacter sp. HBC61]